MTALYKKELRGLLPLLALVGLIFGGDFLYRPLAHRLDEISWVEQSGQLEPGEGKSYAVLLLVVALAAAYSVFPREHDEKTIELLYALPISRPRIFLAKALAAFTVLAAGVVLDQLAGAAVQALNPQSFSGEQWRLGLAARITLLDSFYGALILAHGLLISFLRRFGLILYATAGFAVLQIKKHSPAHAYLDPNELLALEYRGSELVVPWSGLFFHAAVALAALAAAYVLWMGRAERATHLYARLQARAAGKLALGCVTLALTGIGLGWLAVLSMEEAGHASPVRYRPFLPVRAETVWYDFTYAANLSQRARALIREADRAYEEVAAALGAEPGPRIDADLTDEGAAHAGIAQGGVIRVALETLSAEDALYALYHETVHAFQFQLAGGRIPEHMGSVRFFIEGSAEYVAADLLGDPEARRANRRLALAAYERHDIRFEELIDDDELAAVHDGNLVYALGETWTAALAEACGRQAPGRFFRALGRGDAPQDLAGIALWQDTLRAADCALEPVAARWGEAMAALARAERTFLDELPRLGGGAVGVEGEEMVFRARFDRPVAAPAGEYYLRVRRHPEVPESQIYTFTASLEPGSSEVELRVPHAWVEGGSFEFQLGQSIAGAGWPFFEDWQAVSFTSP